MSHLALGPTPDPEKHLLATYSVHSALGPTEAASRIAEEASLGTWTDIPIPKRVSNRLVARAFFAEESLVRVSYPLELFEPSNVGQWLSVFAGNLFALKPLESVRLLDVDIPERLISAFSGPKFGLEDIRKIVGTETTRRPHSGTTFKPKTGMTPPEMAAAAYEAGAGGIDFCKADDTLTDQEFCRLSSRVVSVMEALDRVQEESGRRILYAVNVSSDSDKILDRADTALEHGANCLTINVFTVGLSSLRTLAEDASINVPIHVHTTMHASMTRNPLHGISMLVFAKLIRMLGGDQLHIGTVGISKKDVGEEVTACKLALLKRWKGLKSVFPVVSGGIHPGLIPSIVKTMGKNIVIVAGGGLWGHPRGGRAGAAALNQAIGSVLEGKPIERYAEAHKELRIALTHWGAREQ